jgi:hypothetical protein
MTDYSGLPTVEPRRRVSAAVSWLVALAAVAGALFLLVMLLFGFWWIWLAVNP